MGTATVFSFHSLYTLLCLYPLDLPKDKPNFRFVRDIDLFHKEQEVSPRCNGGLCQPSLTVFVFFIFFCFIFVQFLVTSFFFFVLAERFISLPMWLWRRLDYIFMSLHHISFPNGSNRIIYGKYYLSSRWLITHAFSPHFVLKVRSA